MPFPGIYTTGLIRFIASILAKKPAFDELILNA